jgi:peptide deformylase
MAIRKIVTEKDEILYKQCRPVVKFDEKLWQLLDDMADTMYKADGVGLAGPQVGVLRQVVVIDVGEGKLEVINPTISNTSGAIRETEGCLSVPGRYGYVTRPEKCTLTAQDRYGNTYVKELSGMFCRCACHETDHLKGHLFTELVEEWVED